MAKEERVNNNVYGDGVGRAGESENYMDELQDEQQAGKDVGMALHQVDVDHAAVNLENQPEEPKQVQPTTVIYVPRKDFEARVNQEPYRFSKGVPTRVTLDVANMLQEDEDRGYVKE